MKRRPRIGWLRRLLHRHDWAYAAGNSIGQLGTVRELCLRRVCIGCGRLEEIQYYGIVHEEGGVKYLGWPQWRAVE